MNIRKVILKFKKHPQSINIVAFVAYSLITLCGVFIFHEPWRDEFQIWMIATQSDSIADLIFNYKAEEHPKLWYYILYFLSFLSDSILLKQSFTWLLSIVAAGLILWKSPFTQIQKILLVFGYYILFEYTQMSRVYSFELVLVAMAFSFFKTGIFRWNMAIILCLLAQTTLLGAALSGAFLLYNLLTIPLWKEYIYPYALVFLGFGIALSNAISGAIEWGHLETVSLHQITMDLNWFSSKMATFNNGFAPIPNFFNFHFWNTHIFDVIDSFYTKTLLTIVTSMVLLLGVVISLWKEKRLIWIYFIGAIPMFVLFAFLWHGCTRHHGHFFILYLICHFILMKNGNHTRFSNVFLSMVLLLQFPGGLYAYYQDMNYVFSRSEETAMLVTSKYEGYDTYAGTFDYTMTPISYYSGIHFYTPESKRKVSFIDWSASRFYTSDNTAFEELVHDITKNGSDFGKRILIVKSQPIYSRQLEYQGRELFQLLKNKNNSIDIENWKLSYLASTEKAIVKEEGYHIFELTRKKTNAK